MAFEDVVDLDCSVTYAIGGVDKKSGKKNPTSIEGYYLGSRQVPNSKYNNGMSTLHIFQTTRGNEGVWGKTNLDTQLSTVTPGRLTRVIFIGMVDTKNNPMYKYKLQVDKKNTINVGAESDLDSDESQSAAVYDGDNLNELSEDDDTGAEEPLDEIEVARAVAPRVAAKMPSQEQQRKVQSLLGKKR